MKGRDPFRRAQLAPLVRPSVTPPRPHEDRGPLCLCADWAVEHDIDGDGDRTGRCGKRACGCKRFRPKETP